MDPTTLLALVLTFVLAFLGAISKDLREMNQNKNTNPRVDCIREIKKIYIYIYIYMKSLKSI